MSPGRLPKKENTPQQATLAALALHISSHHFSYPPMSLLPSKDIIPRKILAFRTITSILAMIQQEQPFKVSNELPMDMKPQDRQELKISNAVCNLAITDKDITTVVTKHDDNSLAVIACTHLPRNESSFISLQSPLKMVMARFWQLLITKNFHRDDPKSSTWEIDPTIIDAKIPPGLESDDGEALNKYIEKCW